METTIKKLNKQQLLSSYDETISELVKLLSTFDQETLNIVPFEGSWTAGQVGEHLLKSGIVITQILKGNKQRTERPIDANEKQLESIFLDFSNQTKAAEAVMPSEDPKEKKNLIAGIKTQMEAIRRLAEASDLSLTYTDFPFPNLGEMTFWEWINMINFHTKRHIYQIKNIRKALN